MIKCEINHNELDFHEDQSHAVHGEYGFELNFVVILISLPIVNG